MSCIENFIRPPKNIPNYKLYSWYYDKFYNSKIQNLSIINSFILKEQSLRTQKKKKEYETFIKYINKPPIKKKINYHNKITFILDINQTYFLILKNDSFILLINKYLYLQNIFNIYKNIINKSYNNNNMIFDYEINKIKTIKKKQLNIIHKIISILKNNNIYLNAIFIILDFNTTQLKFNTSPAISDINNFKSITKIQYNLNNIITSSYKLYLFLSKI